LIERSFQGLSVAIETVRIIEELVEIWLNEVCDIDIHQLTAEQQEELIEDLLVLKDVVLIEEYCLPEEEEDFA